MHCTATTTQTVMAYPGFLLVRFAALADELFVFRNVFRLEADAVQVEPELAAVALNPVNLKENVKANC